MTSLTCLDGRRLELLAVPVLDRTDQAYEAVLHLHLEGEPYAVVGERCRGVLAAAVSRGLASTQDDALRRAGLRPADVPHLPRDRELLALRSRDPDDLPGDGALRVLLDVRRRFDRGWQQHEVVILEAWGEQTGVRAELDPSDYLDLLAATLTECERVVRPRG